MPNVLTLETNKYAIKIDNFEGPLDLLCHLIDKNKMDIYDINLSEITDQYIEYIKQMEQINLKDPVFLLNHPVNHRFLIDVLLI